MKKLYAPWRHDYVTRAKEKSKPKDQINEDDCVFCQKFRENDDEKYLILKRFERCAVVMNYYPYNAGHLMVLPLAHKPSLETLDKATRSDMMEAVTHCMTAINSVVKCEGFNIGINIGIAGGGGIPSHLHIHILPRWLGDTNFLTTLTETNLICSDFLKLYTPLHEAFKGVVL